MKYFNIITKEIMEYDEDNLQYKHNRSQWIRYEFLENKIILYAPGDIKIFPKDELGLNKKKIIPLLSHYKPYNKESALKIARYYHICPYCSNELKGNNILILDCKEFFINITNMQVDAYTESNCCGNTYLIPLKKTLSTTKKAEFIREQLNLKVFAICSFKIESLYLEVLIKVKDVAKYLNKDIYDDYTIMRNVFKNKEYIAIKDEDVLQTEDVIIDDLQMQILYYLNRR